MGGSRSGRARIWSSWLAALTLSRSSSSGHGSARVVYAALAANLGIAVAKGVAAALTGSSAMATEAVHSLIDTGNEALLLFGMARSRKPADAVHPFGYGLEVYFWSFIVALLIFALGGGAAIYEGWRRIIEPEPVTRPWISFAVLGAAMLFEGASFGVALRQLNALRRDIPVFQALRLSKDPALFCVVVEDAAALAGLLVALAGLIGSAVFGWMWADGAASLVIGLILVAVAAFLARETRSLMAGEAAAPRIVEAVRRKLEAEPAVDEVLEVLTMHLGPREILLAVTLDYRDDLRVTDVEAVAERLSVQIQAIDPRITRTFVRSARTRAAYAALAGG